MALWRGIGARKDETRGTSPIEVRKTVAALFARPGILPGGASPLLTGDATWAYNVGVANFVTSRGASDGDQLYGNDSVALIGATGVGSTVPIAPGAGLQRIDIAWTRHPTNTENADTASEPLFGVESGVAAASNPVAPVIPAGALEIGRNTMTSAATSTLSAGNTITQSALYTALRGAPVLVRTLAERAALPLSDGLQAYRLDLHSVETYNGTGWVTGDDTGWLPLTARAVGIWDAPTGGLAATARRIGNRVYMTGTQRANSATIGIGTTTGLGTLPAGMFPPAGYNGWAVGWINGSTDVPAEVSITTAGVVTVTNTSVLTGIKFYNISFLTD